MCIAVCSMPKRVICYKAVNRFAALVGVPTAKLKPCLELCSMPVVGCMHC